VRLRYTRRALRQLFAILDHLVRHSPQGAACVARRLAEAISILKLQPRIGVSTQRPGFRRFILSPYPYVVLYKPTQTAVVMHSVRHLACARREV
jgi:toxin ParE1/3/4